MAKKKTRTKPKKAATRRPTTSKKRPSKKPIAVKQRPKTVKPNVAKGSQRKVDATTRTPAKAMDARRPVTLEQLKQFMVPMRKHLSRHCVILAYGPKGTKGFDKWKFATGILLNLGGRNVIVTAGHWASGARSLMAASRLESVLGIYHHASGDLKSVSLASEVHSPKSLKVLQDIDAAILLLSDQLAADIPAQGNHVFTEEQVMKGNMKSPHVVIVGGYPVQGTIITQEVAFYTKREGQLFRHDKIQLGSFAFQTTLLRPKNGSELILRPGFDCNADEFAFRPILGKMSSQHEAGITSAEGMSGGPVVAIVVDPSDSDTFLKPKLLGMQYSQKSIPRKGDVEITELKVVGMRSLLAKAREAIAQKCTCK